MVTSSSSATAKDRLLRTADQLHSAAIHLLRSVRVVDRESGLSPERLSVLSVLAYAGSRTVSELAEAEMVSSPAISRILNGLEDDGMIARERTAADRRQVRVRVTPEGRRLIDAARARRLERLAERLESLGKRDLATLERAAVILEGLGE